MHMLCQQVKYEVFANDLEHNDVYKKGTLQSANLWALDFGWLFPYLEQTTWYVGFEKSMCLPIFLYQHSLCKLLFLRNVLMSCLNAGLLLYCSTATEK
jgi:hypothetical protein